MTTAALLGVLRAHIDREAPLVAVSWLLRTCSIPERAMRARVLTDRLDHLDSHFCYAALKTLLDLSLQRHPAALQLLTDLTSVRPLLGVVGYHKARQIYEIAVSRGRPELARLFLSEASLSPPVPSRQPAHGQNRHMSDTSLGWRKKLARGTDRLALDRLLHDRHPAVIELLLNNSRVIERDVVKIAAMRPTNPDNLVVVFRHARWVERYRVKVALACNPHSPIDLALACLPQLMLQHLRHVEASKQLDPDLRNLARELLRRRGVYSGTVG